MEPSSSNNALRRDNDANGSIKSSQHEHVVETTELQHAFRRLCMDYEELLDETTNGTQPVDERIGLALFKIDEACGVTDLVRADAEVAQEQIMDALIGNCHELEDIFLRINIMERFVNKVQETTRELEKRVDSISRAADPVFNANSVSSLLRSFSKRVGAESMQSPAPAAGLKWEPLAFDFSAKELLPRLDNGDARELGVSISSSSTAPPAAPKASIASSLLSALGDMHPHQQHAPSGMHPTQMQHLYQ